MVIPSGRKVVIKKNSVPLELGTTELVLDEDIQLSLSSTFEPLVGGGGSQLLSVFSGVTRDLGNFSFTGQFKQFSLQVWKSTDPISFSFTCTLNMKTNAYTDVMQPAKTLMKLCLPTDVSESEGTSGYGLIPPGPSILDAFDKTKSFTTSGNLYSIKVGMLNLHPVVIKKIEPIFSRDTDESGYPIMCTLKFDVQTIYTATTGAIDKLDNESTE